MRKNRQYINILIISTGLLSLLGGILSNLASNQIPPVVKPYLQYAWPLLGIVAIVLLVLSVLLNRLQNETEKPSPIISSQNRRRMLERVRAFWITGVLEKSLHSATLIALGLHEQPGAVTNPWHLAFQQPDKSEQPLPPGTRITQVYDKAGGELLILGEPGSGKTTLLLELARDLLDRAEKDDAHPIPAIFNLSSWAAKRQSIADWIVDELAIKYQAPRKIGQSWVDNDQILPLLDGLDEVASDYRAACIEAINAYRQKHMVPMVVCSRKDEYLSQKEQLLLGCAVVVQPLTEQQVDDYLSSAGGQLAAVRVALRKDIELQELATTPLMLSVLTLAYRGMSVDDILAKDSLETRRQQVFATYVQRMLERRGTNIRYTQQQTIHWLAWLAKQMVQHSQTEFYIERLQPDWLPDARSRSVYRVVVVLVVVLFIMLVGGLVFGLVVGPVGGLVGGLAFGLLSGLFVGLRKEIAPTKVIDRSLQRAWRRLVLGLALGLISGLVLGLVMLLFFGLMGRPATGLLFMPFFVLLFMLFGWQYSSLSRKEMDKQGHVTPNQGMWRSARNGLRIGLTYGLIGVLFFGLLGELSGLGGGLLGRPDNWMVVGLAGGLNSVLIGGGDAFIQHFVLRWFFWRAGSMPWRYPRFLDYVADRILLRKVGGGYIFIHRMLLEYFASLDTTP